jgi:hypothetical protein
MSNLKEEFLNDLSALLKKYGAEVEIEMDYGMYDDAPKGLEITLHVGTEREYLKLPRMFNGMDI